MAKKKYYTSFDEMMIGIRQNCENAFDDVCDVLCQELNDMLVGYVYGKEETEILIENRADPYITKGSDGWYYFTASYPMCGGADPEGYDRIILRRSKTGC